MEIPSSTILLEIKLLLRGRGGRVERGGVCIIKTKY
jgi:hypothetical protein